MFSFYELLASWSLSVRASWEAGDFNEMESCEKNKGTLLSCYCCVQDRDDPTSISAIY